MTMSSREAKDPKAMSVLIIDDEEKICELITLFLEATFPFRSVVSAPNVMQAIQKLQNQEFDLLIVDMILTGKSGLDLIKQLRSNPKYNRLKIVLISGYLQQENVIQAVQFGVRQILVKPFTKQQIISHVEEALSIKSGL
jgi:two-component system, chemotaxis family, chemotaxis protein CheY